MKKFFLFVILAVATIISFAAKRMVVLKDDGTALGYWVSDVDSVTFRVGIGGPDECVDIVDKASSYYLDFSSDYFEYYFPEKNAGEVTVYNSRYADKYREYDSVSYKDAPYDILIPCRIVFGDEVYDVTTMGTLFGKGTDLVKSIRIPSSIKEILLPIHYGNLTNFEAFIVDEDNEYYASVDGVLYDKSMSTLLVCPTEKVEVQIPSSVVNLNDKAFSDSKVNKIELPNSVSLVGNSAFYDCVNLESIVLSDSLKIIGEDAFFYCRNLKEIVFPDSLSSIGNAAFGRCNQLESINIPKNIKKIEKQTFMYCTNLKNITLPQGLKSIGGSSFRGCDSLKYIEIPSSVDTIGKYAFYGCSNLDTVVMSMGTYYYKDLDEGNSFPDGTVIIYREKNVDFAETTPFKYLLYNPDENGVRKAQISGKKTWYYKTDTLRIPSLYTENGKIYIVNALKDCYIADWNFSCILFHDSLVEIGSCIFKNNESLTSDVVIPASVTKLGYDIFSNCPNLENIHVAPGNPNYISLDGVVYSKDTSIVIYCPEGKTHVEIPECVRTIGEHAFCGCEKIKKIKLPDSLKIIDTYAFAGSGLKEIDLPNTLKSINGGAFNGTDSLKYVELPPTLESINYAFNNSGVDTVVISATTKHETIAQFPETTVVVMRPDTTKECEFVDLGLPSGLKWSSMELGRQKRFDIPYRFNWGGLFPKVNYGDYKLGTFNKDDSTLIAQGMIDESTRTLTKYYDAASSQLGRGCRMPTIADFEELVNECDWEWVVEEGGYIVTSKHNGKSITFTELENGSKGYYWTSNVADGESNLSWAFLLDKKALKSEKQPRKEYLVIRPVKD